MNFEIIIFYKYTPVSDPKGFVCWMKTLCEEVGIFGRILIAREGINGTVEGTPEQIVKYEQALLAQDGSTGTFGDFSDVWFKSSPGTGKAFKKLKVKERREIVSTGLSSTDDVDPTKRTGIHLSADELKAMFERGENFEIVDMRNDYEYAVGHFSGSRNSEMANFRDLCRVPEVISDMKEKKIVTVCTYGVRCEKASAYLLQNGFTSVYQLHGGIGTYMKQFPGQDFVGSLYVFDERMTEQFTSDYPIVGKCFQCAQPSERFGNCAWYECHKQIIICEACSDQKIFCKESCMHVSSSNS